MRINSYPIKYRINTTKQMSTILLFFFISFFIDLETGIYLISEIKTRMYKQSRDVLFLIHTSGETGVLLPAL